MNRCENAFKKSQKAFGAAEEGPSQFNIGNRYRSGTGKTILPQRVAIYIKPVPGNILNGTWNEQRKDAL